MSLILLAYQFSQAEVEPPTGNQIRFNATYPYGAVTRIWVRHLTVDGADMRLLLLEVPIGSRLLVQDKNDSNMYGTFVTTMAPVAKTDYVEFVVNHTGHGNSLLAQAASFLITTPVDTGTPIEPSEPTIPYEFSHVVISAPLVSLATAKQHLRITDALHDADISQKLAAAQQQILSKLGYAADPAWTETTIPTPVAHAILLALDAFYERRGGDEAADALRKSFEAIDLLLALYRDPALA